MVSTAGTPAPTSSSSGPRVIVADDSPEQRNLLRVILEGGGFEVIEAVDGRELFWALERSRRPRAMEPAVVIVDVQMPVYNGLDVIEAWSEEPWPGACVVITSFPDDAITRRALALGATLLAKPFTSHQLTSLVRGLIEGGEGDVRGVEIAKLEHDV